MWVSVVNIFLSAILTVFSMVLIWLFGPMALTPITYFVIKYAFRREYKKARAGLGSNAWFGISVVGVLIFWYIVVSTIPERDIYNFLHEILQSQWIKVGFSEKITNTDYPFPNSDYVVKLNVIYLFSLCVLAVSFFYNFINFEGLQTRIYKQDGNMKQKSRNSMLIAFVALVLGTIALNLFLYSDFLLPDADRLDGLFRFRAEILANCLLLLIGITQLAMWMTRRRMN